MPWQNGPVVAVNASVDVNCRLLIVDRLQFSTENQFLNYQLWGWRKEVEVRVRWLVIPVDLS